MPKKYSPQEKMLFYEEHQSGVTIKELSIKHSVSQSSLYNWFAKFKPIIETKKIKFTVQDYISLKCENTRLEKLIEIYSTTGVTPKSPMKERLKIIDTLNNQFSLAILLKAFNVNKSSYYSHLKALKQKTTHEQTEEKFKIEVKNEFEKWKCRLGSKKLHVKLKERGITIGVNRISKLMK